MGFMPGTVSRDRFFRRFDELLNAHQGAILAKLCESDRTMSVLETAVEAHREHHRLPDGSLPPVEPIDQIAIDCTKQFWAAIAGGYFAIDPAIYSSAVRKQVTTAAYVRALELSGNNKQIRSYYCCVGSSLEATVLAVPEDNVIQVMIFTGELDPKIVLPPTVKFVEQEHVWISTIKARVDATLRRANIERPVESNVFADGVDVVYADAAKTIGTVRPREMQVSVPAEGGE